MENNENNENNNNNNNDNDNKVIYEREGYTPVLVENGSTEPSNIDDMVYGE